jgi:gag-polypeptide of LTR copia-type
MADEKGSRYMRLEQLVGKTDWMRWRAKVLPLIRDVKCSEDALNNKLEMPVDPGANAAEKDKKAYELADEKYRKAVNHAMKILLNGVTDEVLDKVMRFTEPWDIWTELHRLYDGIAEDKVYTLATEFFEYRPSGTEDISGMLAKLRTTWGKLNVEIAKTNVKYKDLGLPDVLLNCKILGSLSDEYFGFKASWMMQKEGERTVENLQTKLIAHERELLKKGAATTGGEPEMALFAGNRGNGNVGYRGERRSEGVPVRCFFCGLEGHRVRQCQKWIAADRPGFDWLKNGSLDEKKPPDRTRTGDIVGDTRESSSHQVSASFDWSVMEEPGKSEPFDWHAM